MNKVLIFSIGVIIVVAVGVWYFYLPSDAPRNLGQQGQQESNAVLYEKRSGWGPCPNPDGGCFENVTLYGSGKLVIERGTRTREITIDTKYVKSEIQRLGLLTRRCDYTPVVDYWATYTISLDGVTRKITFPGCEAELRDMDGLLADIIEQYN